jgi:hypothetical protein
MDPGLGAQIMAMHLKKVETYPDWGRLMDTIPDVRISS